MTVSTAGLENAAVLAALYNASAPLGMGFLQYKPAPMTTEQAAPILAQYGGQFDYLHGRLMKVYISGEEIEAGGYDRDNGDGAAEAAIQFLRETGDPCCDGILAIHAARTDQSVESLKAKLDTKTEMTTEGGVPVMSLGFADVAPQLNDALNRVHGA